MRLHVKECTGCNRIQICVAGDTEWCQWRQGGYVEDIRRTHEVISHELIHCNECLRKVQTHIAETAGAVH